MTGAVWVIHGVAHADAPTPVGAPPHVRAAAGDLIALVSQTQADDGAEADVALALRHNALLTAYAMVCDVAPARLGAASADPEAAGRAVSAEGPRHRASLARIAGRIEGGLRIVAPPAPEPVPGSLSEPDASPAGAGWLRARAAARAGVREAAAVRMAGAQAVASAAAAMADMTLALRPGVPRTPGGLALAELALLTPRDRFAAMAEAATEAARAAGLIAEITGPWPCYSFAALEEEPASVEGVAS